MLFTVGNAKLEKKIANTISLTMMLTLCALYLRLVLCLECNSYWKYYPVLYSAKVNIKWQRFSVLFVSFINRQKLNKMLFSKFRVWILCTYAMVSTVLHSTRYRQVHCFQQRMSVPKGARFKQIYMLFGKAYSHSRVDLFGESTWT